MHGAFAVLHHKQSMFWNFLGASCRRAWPRSFAAECAGVRFGGGVFCYNNTTAWTNNNPPIFPLATCFSHLHVVRGWFFSSACCCLQPCMHCIGVCDDDVCLDTPALRCRRAVEVLYMCATLCRAPAPPPPAWDFVAMLLLAGHEVSRWPMVVTLDFDVAWTLLACARGIERSPCTRRARWPCHRQALCKCAWSGSGVGPCARQFAACMLPPLRSLGSHLLIILGDAPARD